MRKKDNIKTLGDDNNWEDYSFNYFRCGNENL